MSFTGNITPEWIEAQYLQWRQAPESFSVDWRAFFEGFELGQGGPPAAGIPVDLALKFSAVQSLIYRYRDIGHLLACTDPLSPCSTSHPLLDLEAFTLSDADLDTVFHTRRFLKESATLREILELLQETYCRSIGVEFMHIQEPGERQWLIDRMETARNRRRFTQQERINILRKLQEASLFEEFLHRKFIGQKRFSLEGGEALIPFLDAVVQRAAKYGVSDLILGMAHRGRLNVLANEFGKPLATLFAEFKDNAEFGFVGDGDVKYHKGFSADVRVADGNRIHLTLTTNPSHLEAVDPVVEGKSRARQDRYGEGGDKRVLPVLIHGDAAFAGQGVVAEVFNLSQLEGYRTGGTLHIVVNNQIGFTTLPKDARSTCYATDMAKMVQAPVFHVHGEDPEAVVYAAGLALDYRRQFGRDVVVEIICYRRHGHSEGDEPYFTQPLMYETIKDRPPVHELYAGRLMEEGVPRETVEGAIEEIKKRLDSAMEEKPPVTDVGFGGPWSGIKRGYAPTKIETGVARETLLELGRLSAAIPEGFTPHPKIEAGLRKRLEELEKGEAIDWGNAESLAFATLLREGISVRLSGQDSRRGTFNHRHSALFDQATGAVHVPLAATGKNGAKFHVFDSMLSENAVLGFEYGYSVETPSCLTIWEAQFGDFANGGQVVIDQFIAAGETKWDRVSGLVMLLPHGYEGMGAEHSSARIERYLQLCANNNIQVCYPSTPAQLFHCLRRQVKQPFRKPLVVFTPKSLLRHPICVSRSEELESGYFREVLPTLEKPGDVKAVLVCSGKIYYELLERKEEEKRDDVAIIRIEQFYPLRYDLLREALEPFKGKADIAWVQEEPRNMGAWNFLRTRLAEILGEEPRYIGRDEDAAPATGSHRMHKEQQERIINEAFGQK